MSIPRPMETRPARNSAIASPVSVVCSEAVASNIVPSGIYASGIVPSKADALLEGAPETVPEAASEPQ